ncbi:MAG TPA: RidA family protein, partial [Candidatus Paceibacterota bacterium]|nr:RidA family protein [Candidatus Paceibacterota bacterium]
AGIQVFAVAGIRVGRIALQDRIVGTVYEHAGTRQCLLAGIGPAANSTAQLDQCSGTFENMSSALEESGFTMADIVRTWFYNESILAWYSDFNRIRTGVYSRIAFQTGSTPASTGVAGRNPQGSALTTAVWAVQPLDVFARVEEVTSPLQCPAPAYGSSFSRATEILSGAGRRLFISGTASIAPEGETLWKGDARRQIEQTMKVVEAILTSRGYALTDLSRVIAYFKQAADAPLFAEWCAARGVSLPYLAVECDICRHDLLFELEADAFKSRD